MGHAICEHGRQRSMVQGVRWGCNLRTGRSVMCKDAVGLLRARRDALQGVRWVTNMRARSSAHYMQGVRWGINLRARSSALLDARSAALHKISRVEDITSSPRSPRHSFAVAADPTAPPLTRSPTAPASSRTSSNPCDALNATRSLHVFAGTVGGLMAGT